MHQLRQPRRRALRRSLRRTDDEHTALVDGARADRVALRLLARRVLAGEHRLVDGGDAGEDETVRRERLARLHQQLVAHDERLERHTLSGAEARALRQ